MRNENACGVRKQLKWEASIEFSYEIIIEICTSRDTLIEILLVKPSLCIMPVLLWVRP